MPHKTITLRKAVAGAPKAFPVGWTYEYTYTSATTEAARQKAWRALKRDHPNENPMCWELVA